MLQGDAIRNFTGDIDQAGFVGFKARSAGVLYEDAYDDGQDTSLGHLPKGKGLGSGICFDASRATPVAQEIRPVNRAVHYLIRTR